MRLQARIVLTEEEAEEVFKPLGVRTDLEHGLAIAHIFTDDELYGRIKDEMKRRGIHFNEEVNAIFDRMDMETAEYFRMVPRAQWGYPEPQDDWGGRSYDKSSACPSCGTGGNQVRPFLVRGPPKFGRGDITALFWVYEFLVTDRLHDIVEESGFTGIELWPVIDYADTRQESPLKGCWQLRFTNELPPMSQSVEFPAVTLVRNAQCHCGRIGRNIPRAPLRYVRADLACAKDFNKTKEWLGGGLDTSQLKITSRSVYESFIKNGVKGVDFQPIVIEES